MFTFATEQIDASASPLKPSVVILFKSSAILILLVVCGKKATIMSSFSIPHPLSETIILEIPPLNTSTLTCVEPASMAFSTNSFTIELGRSTTSPAAILLKTAGSNMFILDIIISPFVLIPKVC